MTPGLKGLTQFSSSSCAMLMRPDKAETAVHSCWLFCTSFSVATGFRLLHYSRASAHVRSFNIRVHHLRSKFLVCGSSHSLECYLTECFCRFRLWMKRFTDHSLESNRVVCFVYCRQLLWFCTEGRPRPLTGRNQKRHNHDHK